MGFIRTSSDQNMSANRPDSKRHENIVGLRSFRSATTHREKITSPKPQHTLNTHKAFNKIFTFISCFRFVLIRFAVHQFFAHLPCFLRLSVMPKIHMVLALVTFISL